MVCKRLWIAFLIWLFPTVALSLTPSECADLTAKYGVVSPACQNNANAEATSLVTPDLPVTAEQEQDNVFFVGGGSDLDERALRQIRALGEVFNTPVMQDACFQLVGHSDSSGSDIVNLDIGLARAQAVSAAISSLVAPERVESVISQGEWQPLTNIPPSHPYQRRVEIRARKCP